jgi:tetratricopeptide (TPR) repeat protein
MRAGTCLRQELAWVHNSLGVVLRSTGRPREAEDAYRQAIGIQVQLVAQFPNVPEHKNDLAGTLVNLAMISFDCKQFTQAREHFQRATHYHNDALRADPGNRIYQEFFRNNRTALALVLAAIGDHDEAGRTAKNLADLRWDPAADAYSAACLLAQCVPVTLEDTKLTDAKRQEWIHSYIELALAMLRKAIVNGYKDGASLYHNAALDPLRPNPEFLKILQLAGVTRAKHGNQGINPQWQEPDHQLRTEIKAAYGPNRRSCILPENAA